MCYHVSTFDWIKALETEKPVSLNRDVYDGFGFFHRSPIRIRNTEFTKNLSIFNPKIIAKL